MALDAAAATAGLLSWASLYVNNQKMSLPFFLDVACRDGKHLLVMPPCQHFQESTWMGLLLGHLLELAYK